MSSRRLAGFPHHFIAAAILVPWMVIPRVASFATASVLASLAPSAAADAPDAIRLYLSGALPIDELRRQVPSDVAMMLEATQDYRARHPLIGYMPQGSLDRFLSGRITLAQLEERSRDDLYAFAEEGYAAFKSGELVTAQRVFRALVAYNPFDAHFHSGLGAILQKSGSLGDAVGQYSLAIKFNPQDTCSLTNRGETLLRLDRVPEAIADFEKAIGLDPKGRDPWAVRSRDLLAQCRTAVSTTPSAQVSIADGVAPSTGTKDNRSVYSSSDLQSGAATTRQCAAAADLILMAPVTSFSCSFQLKPMSPFARDFFGNSFAVDPQMFGVQGVNLSLTRERHLLVVGYTGRNSISSVGVPVNMRRDSEYGPTDVAGIVRDFKITEDSLHVHIEYSGIVRNVDDFIGPAERGGIFGQIRIDGKWRGDGFEVQMTDQCRRRVTFSALGDDGAYTDYFVTWTGAGVLVPSR